MVPAQMGKLSPKPGAFHLTLKLASRLFREGGSSSGAPQSYLWLCCWQG